MQFLYIHPHTWSTSSFRSPCAHSFCLTRSWSECLKGQPATHIWDFNIKKHSSETMTEFWRLSHPQRVWFETTGRNMAKHKEQKCTCKTCDKTMYVLRAEARLVTNWCFIPSQPWRSYQGKINIIPQVKVYFTAHEAQAVYMFKENRESNWSSVNSEVRRHKLEKQNHQQLVKHAKLVNFKLWEPLTAPGSQLRDLDFCICRTPLWEYTAKAFTNTTQFLHFAGGIHCQTIHEYHSVPVYAGHHQHLLFASAVFCWG